MKSKSEELKNAAVKAKLELNDELDSFIEKIDKATDDPNNFITMTQLENEWRDLSLKTHKEILAACTSGLAILVKN